jgi:hypothetical protein
VEAQRKALELLAKGGFHRAFRCRDGRAAVAQRSPRGQRRCRYRPSSVGGRALWRRKRRAIVWFS